MVAWSVYVDMDSFVHLFITHQMINKFFLNCLLLDRVRESAQIYTKYNSLSMLLGNKFKFAIENWIH